MNEYQRFIELKQKIADLDNIIGVLRWDEEVNMPVEGAPLRAQQNSSLSGILHDMNTSEDLGTTLEYLNKHNTLGFKERRNVEESLRVYRKAKSLNRKFVERQSRLVSEAYNAWMKARQEDSFSIFSPKLKELVELEREKASLYGYDEHPYDALLDDYEPGLTTSEIQKVFDDVRIQLGAFYEKVKDQEIPDSSFFDQNFPKVPQLELCHELITFFGYNWNAGRLDLSEHPFSTSFGPKDARITTRVNLNDLRESVWGSLHETGHALYEQGLLLNEYGLPSGQPVSLSVHESQSRLWENNVGKSWPYIQAVWPVICRHFPTQFKKVTAEQFFKGLNAVTPNLIRINSDEVTYHFHILLRFEIEKALIEGSLEVEDLEEFWNAKIKEYLGLDVPSAKQGVLQDIHWSHGSFGYFPTYSLGSFYAAQFYAAASGHIPDLEKEIQKLNFKPLLQWLRENIHAYGHTYNSQELCKKVTGEELNYKYFNAYLYDKYSKIYSL